MIKSVLNKLVPLEDLEKLAFLQTLHALNKVRPKAAAQLALRRFATPQNFEEPESEREQARQGTSVEFQCGLRGFKYGSGPIVMLVHGWSGRGLQLGALIPPLIDRGLAVLALDGPAHGRSPGPQTSPTHFATFLKSVGRELGPLHAIVAHSFGAGASVLATDNGLKVEKLVLAACLNRYDRILENYCKNIGLGAEATHEFMQLIGYRVGFSPKNFHLTHFLANLNQRILVIHDRGDREIPFSEAEELVSCNKNARLILTEGHGHRRLLKSEVFVNKVTEFLTS